MKNKVYIGMAVCLLAGLLADYLLSLEVSAAEAASMKGLGSLAGSVKAPKPFKAARVYAENLDKNVLYMVYTHNGNYQVINLMPGNYEIRIRKRGFSSQPQKVSIGAGQKPILDFELKEAALDPVLTGGFMGPGGAGTDAKPLYYDELYPPGPERELAEKTCMWCHGTQFFNQFQKTEEEWDAAIGRMTSETAYLARGAQIPAETLSPENRRRIAGYLGRNFGPGSPKRRLKLDVEFPLDEEALSRAMYVEYPLPLGQSSQRMAQDPYFDNRGNVWFTDRGQINMVGRLDPRTAIFTDFPLPENRVTPHGLTVDSQGMVFWAETRGLHLGRLNPDSGEMVRFPMDPKGEIPGGAGHTPVLDSKENVWFTVIRGNKLGKWDRKTEQATLWEVPTSSSSPYGILVDQKDKVWMTEFRRGKVASFDPVTEKWTEYAALTQPCSVRRLGIDSKGIIWYGGFSCGKLGRIDPESGKIVEYDLPLPFSEPYDVWPDAEDNVWISDGGQGGALIKFDQQQEKFTYYPAPRRTDMPKVEITREGAIWYCTRSADETAVGVLYPDVSKMTLGAYY
jgi:virginiamycin B lyase